MRETSRALERPHQFWFRDLNNRGCSISFAEMWVGIRICAIRELSKTCTLQQTKKQEL